MTPWTDENRCAGPGDLNRVVSKLEMTQHNVMLFEESDQYRKAIDYYLDTGDFYRARRYFMHRERDEEYAEILEHRGLFGEAAWIYETNQDLENAARCYERMGYHEKAGEMYFKSKEYPKALDAYLREPPLNRKKLARTYEKLADWENALRIYQEVGDAKGNKRCKNKIDRIKAKQATPRLPFEQV